MFGVKVVLLAVVVSLAAGEVIQGYHGAVGIPAAARMKEEEAAESRVVGGIAVPLGAHPYFAGLLVTLTTGLTSFCGGTLLSSRRVLTAGTCWFDGYFQGRAITVVLGSLRIYSGGTRVTASGVFVHPDFNALRRINDVAVLMIPNVILSANIAAVTLPTSNESYVGRFVHAVGFGKTGDWAAIGTDQAQSAVALPVITNAVCERHFPSYVSEKTLCTSGNNGWGVCGGDAGGPLVYIDDVNNTRVQIGVIIGPAPSGCQAGLPSIYTKVYPYLKWIKSFL